MRVAALLVLGSQFGALPGAVLCARAHTRAPEHCDGGRPMPAATLTAASGAAAAPCALTGVCATSAAPALPAVAGAPSAIPATVPPQFQPADLLSIGQPPDTPPPIA